MIFEIAFLGSDLHPQLQFARAQIQTLWIERLSSVPRLEAEVDVPTLRALVSHACEIALLELASPSRCLLPAGERVVESSLDAFFEAGRIAFREVALALIEHVNDARAVAVSIAAVSEAFERMRQREAGTFRALLRAGSCTEAGVLDPGAKPQAEGSAPILAFEPAH